MATKNAPKQYPVLDDVREAIQQHIADHLTTRESGSGNTYFTLPEREMPMTCHGVTGRLSVSWFGLKDAEAVEAKRAATVADTADSLVKRMTPEEKRAYAEKLLADL